MRTGLVLAVLLSLVAHGVAVALVFAVPAAAPLLEPLPVRILLEGGDVASEDPAPAAPVVSPAPLREAAPPKQRVAAARTPRSREPQRPVVPAPALAASEMGAVGPPTGEAAAAEPVEVAAALPAGAGAGGRPVRSEGEVDGVAMPVQRVRPHYPDRARRLGREGEVRVTVTVEASGDVSRVDVLKSGGEDFDREALAAIRRERWLPAKRAGEAVATAVTFTVKFRLED